MLKSNFLKRLFLSHENKSPIGEVTVEYFSDIGRRQYQEDNFYLSKDKKLFIVCDGVGGQVNGHLASETIVLHIGNLYDKHKGKIDSLILNNFISSAKTALNKLVEENNELDGLASTIALCYIGNKSVITCHVGDSRIIFVDRTNEKLWATRDHSVVQDLLDSGVLSSEEEAIFHPMKNKVTRILQGSLKNNEALQIDNNEIKCIHPEDIIIICSDGVLEDFTSQMIADQFMTGNYLNKWNYLKHYCSSNSSDNNTAILIKF